MNSGTTVNENEKEKFNAHQSDWWDIDGPLKTLHDINPTRIAYIEEYTQLDDLFVLDVGCGGGILCEGLAKRSAKVTGIDVAQTAINTAIEHANENRLNIKYTCTPIENFSGPKYNVITCLEMLEHVDSPELVLKHCNRLLKNGGKLFLSTINRTPVAYVQVILAAEYIIRLLPRQTHDYDKFLKPSELAKMCRRYGFEVIDIQGLKYNPITRTSRLSGNPNVNYLMVCEKS